MAKLEAAPGSSGKPVPGFPVGSYSNENKSQPPDVQEVAALPDLEHTQSKVRTRIYWVVGERPMGGRGEDYVILVVPSYDIWWNAIYLFAWHFWSWSKVTDRQKKYIWLGIWQWSNKGAGSTAVGQLYTWPCSQLDADLCVGSTGGIL